VTLVVEFMLGFVGILRIEVFPPGMRIERPDVLHELEWLHGHTLIMMAMCEFLKIGRCYDFYPRNPADSDTLLPISGKNPERGKSGSADMTRFLEEDVPGDVENSANNAAGEKKKGKKGKVVDPSLLGFSVTSNRILMGEIQHVED
jgi:hypothetical protein